MSQKGIRKRRGSAADIPFPAKVSLSINGVDIDDLSQSSIRQSAAPHEDFTDSSRGFDLLGDVQNDGSGSSSAGSANSFGSHVSMVDRRVKDVKIKVENMAGPGEEDNEPLRHVLTQLNKFEEGQSVHTNPESQEAAALEQLGEQARIEMLRRESQKKLEVNQVLLDLDQSRHIAWQRRTENLMLDQSRAVLQVVNAEKEFHGSFMAFEVIGNLMQKTLNKEKKKIEMAEHMMDDIVQFYGYCMKQDAFIKNDQLEINLLVKPSNMTEVRKMHIQRRTLDASKNIAPDIARANKFMHLAKKDFDHHQNLDFDMLVSMKEAQNMPQIAYNQSHLKYILEQKPKSQRNDNDIKELRQIMMNFDFIKNNEHTFQKEDLSEMAKSCEIRKIHPLKPLYKAGEDANTMFFVIQGTFLITYKLKSRDKRAKFLESQDVRVNEDGVMKAIAAAKAIKDEGTKLKREAEMPFPCNSDALSSNHSCNSRSSKVSRRKTRKIFDQTAVLNTARRASILKASGQDPQPLPQRVNNITDLMMKLADKKGEQERKAQYEANPLSNMSARRWQEIQDLEAAYIADIEHPDHYVKKKDEPVRLMTNAADDFMITKSASRKRMKKMGLDASFMSNMSNVSNVKTAMQIGNLHLRNQKKPPVIQKQDAEKEPVDYGKLLRDTIAEAKQMKKKEEKLKQKEQKAKKNKKPKVAQRQSYSECESLDGNLPNVGIGILLSEKTHQSKSISVGRLSEDDKDDLTFPKAPEFDLRARPQSSMQKSNSNDVRQGSQSKHRLGQQQEQLKDESKFKQSQNTDPDKKSRSMMHESLHSGVKDQKSQFSLDNSQGKQNQPKSTLKQNDNRRTDPPPQENSYSQLDSSMRSYNRRTNAPRLTIGNFSEEKPKQNHLDQPDSSGLQVNMGNAERDFSSSSSPSQSLSSRSGKTSGGSYPTTSDNLELESICNDIFDTEDKDVKNELPELPLFNIKTGQLMDTKVLLNAVSDYKKQMVRVCSAYSRYNTAYVVVFEKESYRKAVENVKNRAKQEKLEFLKSVNVISQFQRKSQKLLVPKLVRKTLNRHQMLYKEGERADKVYLVISGEFKVTKKIHLLEKEQWERHQNELLNCGLPETHIFNQLFQGNLAASAISRQSVNEMASLKKKGGRIEEAKTQTHKVQVLDLLIVTEKGMLGDEDVFMEREGYCYQTSCECISRQAEVYELKQDEYLKECKKQPHWQEIVDKVQEKADKYAGKILQKNEVQMQFKSQSMNMTEPGKETNPMDQQVKKWTDTENSLKLKAEQKFKNFAQPTPSKISRQFTSPQLKEDLSIDKFDSVFTKRRSLVSTQDPQTMTQKLIVSKTSLCSPLSSRVKTQHLQMESLKRDFKEAQSSSRSLAGLPFASNRNTNQKLSQIRSNSQAASYADTAPQMDQVTTQGGYTMRTASMLGQARKSQQTMSFQRRSFLTSGSKVPSQAQPLLAHQQIQEKRPSFDVADIARFLPSDLKSAMQKHFGSTHSVHQQKHDRMLYKQHRHRILNVESTLLSKQQQLDIKASRFPVQSSKACASTDRLREVSKKFSSAQNIHQKGLFDQIAPTDLKGRVKILNEQIQLKEDKMATQSVKRAVNLLDGMQQVGLKKSYSAVTQPNLQVKEDYRMQTFGVIRDHDLAMKDVKTLKRQSKKLHLNTKKKQLEPGQGSAPKAANEKAEASRASFLLRQANLRSKLGPESTGGTYGHFIARQDPKVSGVSVLAQKICVKQVGQQAALGGKQFIKHGSLQSMVYLSHVSSAQLIDVEKKLLRPSQLKKGKTSTMKISRVNKP